MYTQIINAILERSETERTINLVATDKETAKIKNFVVSAVDKYFIVVNLNLPTKPTKGAFWIWNSVIKIKKIVDAENNIVALTKNEILVLKELLYTKSYFKIHSIKNKKVA